MLGTSSVNTTQTANQEQKKLVQKLVSSRKRNISLSALLLFGVIALSGFLALVIS